MAITKYEEVLYAMTEEEINLIANGKKATIDESDQESENITV